MPATPPAYEDSGASASLTITLTSGSPAASSFLGSARLSQGVSLLKRARAVAGRAVIPGGVWLCARVATEVGNAANSARASARIHWLRRRYFMTALLSFSAEV